ncbi:hypothetical protein [Fodinibius halophilus]|uniref:Uncharacterized protein n=1 Tax=Fodinibius halophilus TaxID=1736908 RepID=A0A6M1T5E3_9BACT|nr:hypothetical protein [Fodinibius halophilus]NGP89297.1 hypothetical protein [Fodinibius halophilus]
MDTDPIEKGHTNFVNEYPEDYNKNRDFTSLKAWEKSRKVKLFFYKKILPILPDQERYQLSSQNKQCCCEYYR